MDKRMREVDQKILQARVSLQRHKDRVGTIFHKLTPVLFDTVPIVQPEEEEEKQS